jgi:hypothetical protein
MYVCTAGSAFLRYQKLACKEDAGVMQLCAQHVCSSCCCFMQAAEDGAHWRSFCEAVASAAAAAGPQAAAGPGTAEETGAGAVPYHRRIPQLAKRLQHVLSPAIADAGFLAGRWRDV